MKLQIPSGILNGVLTVGKLASGRYNALLGNILLEAQDGSLRCTATDGEMRMSRAVQCTVDQSGTILAPATLLAGICAKLPAGDVKLSIEDNQLLVEAGRTRFRLPTANPAEYPPDGKRPDGTALALPCAAVKQMLSQTTHSAVPLSSAGHNAHYENCSMWVADGTMLQIFSSDGHALSLAQKEAQSEPLTLMLPLAAAKLLQASLPDDDSPLTVYRTGGAYFEFAQTTLRCPLYDMMPPPTKSILTPADDAPRVYFETAALKAILQRLLPLFDQTNYNKPVVDIRGTRPVEIVTWQAKHGEGRDELQTSTMLDEPISITVDATLVLGLLSVLTGPEVVLTCGKSVLLVADPRQPDLIQAMSYATKPKDGNHA